MNGLSRGRRKVQIYRIICNNPGITTYALAKQMGMTNSKHFRQIVQEMMDSGEIVGSVEAKTASINRYRWFDASALNHAI